MKLDQDNTTIGFIDIITLTEKKKKYFGGLLVTDLKGIPIEFKCTHPVKPTAVQQKLYGDMLIPYISVNLCGFPLFNSLERKPNILLCKKNIFLDLRSDISTPIFFIQDSSQVIGLEEESATNGIYSETIKKVKNQSGPIKVGTKNQYKSDLIQYKDYLENLTSMINLSEPFDRIERAMEMISNQDDRFQ